MGRRAKRHAYVSILRLTSEGLYVGVTVNLAHRITERMKGSGWWTRAKREALKIGNVARLLVLAAGAESARHY